MKIRDLFVELICLLGCFFEFFLKNSCANFVEPTRYPSNLNPEVSSSGMSPVGDFFSE